MTTVQKKSLKLPLVLIIGPIVVLILVIFLQAITEPEVLKPTGDAYLDHMNSQTYETTYEFSNL